MNRFDKVNIEQFFKIRNARSVKGHSRKLKKNQDMMKYFCSNRVMDTWNKLTEEIVNAD